jgi:hypothetical protein
MSHGKFSSPVALPSAGRVTVTGPFDPDDPEVNFARVLFLVIQGNGPNTVVVPGQGWWSRGNGDWSGDIQRNGVADLGPSTADLQTGVARGIAVSIVIKPGKVLPDDTFDPPSIEALTWCADFMIS